MTLLKDIQKAIKELLSGNLIVVKIICSPDIEHMIRQLEEKIGSPMLGLNSSIYIESDPEMPPQSFLGFNNHGEIVKVVFKKELTTEKQMNYIMEKYNGKIA